MKADYRKLLELSARAEEQWLLTHQARYENMARQYLQMAKDAPR